MTQPPGSLFGHVLRSLALWVLLPGLALSALAILWLQEAGRRHQLERMAAVLRQAGATVSQQLEAGDAPETAFRAACRRLQEQTGGLALGRTSDGLLVLEPAPGSELVIPDSGSLQRFGESVARQFAMDGKNGMMLQAHTVVRANGRPAGALLVIRPWNLSANPALLLAVLTLFAAAALPCAAFGISRGLNARIGELTGLALADGESGSPSDYDRDPLAGLGAAILGARRHHAEQLREARGENRRWQALFASIREGVVAVTRDRELTAMNRAARRFLGVPVEVEVVGRELVGVVRNAALCHFINDLIDGKERFQERDMELTGRNEDIIFLRLSGVRLDAEDGGGAVVILHDISHLKRLEALRGEFVANVSHELRTPLTAIHGFVEPLADSLGRDPEQARTFLGTIRRHSDRMTAIIEDLLTLSRLEQDELEATRSFNRRDLSHTVAQAVSRCQAQMNRKVMIRTHYSACIVLGNHRLLEQAAANLLDNACKYSFEDGEVEVRVAPEAGEAVLTVRDHGIGIPREHLKRIFERFYRVDKARDRKTGGTGLGLSIVKHIARLHGGSVGVTSEPGEGATFFMRLPLPEWRPGEAAVADIPSSEEA